MYFDRFRADDFNIKDHESLVEPGRTEKKIGFRTTHIVWYVNQQ